MKVRIVFTGRSYPSGRRLPTEMNLSEGSTVDDLLRELQGLLGDSEAIPASCLLAVSGDHLGTVGQHSARSLSDGDELLLIAPVAGG